MPITSRPETINEYLEWALATLGMDFGATTTRNRYETNLQNAQNVVQNSRFMREFPHFIAQAEEKYQGDTGAGLLMTSELTVMKKPFGSAVTKSYRQNVLRNRNFPNPPRDGWIGPDNWYQRFDDLVRSTLVCKFLDGPKVLAPALDEYAKSVGLNGTHVPRNTDDGYYAFHHYTGFPVDIVDAGWEARTTTVKFEIQLTTQLQEVLRELTHPIYENSRVAIGPREDGWKWEVDSPRFRTSYLGHTLHLIEALIVEVRDSSPEPQHNVPQTDVLNAAPTEMENSPEAVTVAANESIKKAAGEVSKSAIVNTAEAETNAPIKPMNAEAAEPIPGIPKVVLKSDVPDPVRPETKDSMQVENKE